MNKKMRIHNYYKEKQEVNYRDFYIKIGLFGAFLAFMFIGGFKLLIFLIKMLVKYWIWAIVIIACAFVARHFLIKRKIYRG